jgi:hypothetical protein
VTAAVEIADVILEPHFDAVKDTFVEFEPQPGANLSRLRKTRLVVDPTVHDTPRHYARCRDDGFLIEVAPEAVELPLERLVAILAHEFGHASDFAYPGCWVIPQRRGEKAKWIGDDNSKAARFWRERLWHERDSHQVELGADAIAYAVTGRKIHYCGPCMVQCFNGGKLRPRELR